VVEVGVRHEQPLRRREARLLDERRQQLELFGQHRRVDRERLRFVADDRAVRLKQLARDDDHVTVQRDRPHGWARVTVGGPPPPARP
jgi:hypothetical protein